MTDRNSAGPLETSVLPRTEYGFPEYEGAGQMSAGEAAICAKIGQVRDVVFAPSSVRSANVQRAPTGRA